MKYSKAPVGVGRDDQEHLSEKEANIDDLIPNEDGKSRTRTTDLRNWKGKKQDASTRPSGKKYVNLKLIDFGCRSRSSSSTSGKSVIRGDASLSLLLFEADRVEDIVGEDGKKKKVYRGGSRGAFEQMSKLKEGAVIALLNPRILKPYQVCSSRVLSTTVVLTVTISSGPETLLIRQTISLPLPQSLSILPLS